MLVNCFLTTFKIMQNLPVKTNFQEYMDKKSNHKIYKYVVLIAK